MEMDAVDPHASLIYDWNPARTGAPIPAIEFFEETLRDGLQSPSATDPTLDEKLELVHLMSTLGIKTANIGLPIQSERAREHISAVAREMHALGMRPAVACRTDVAEIGLAADITQATGVPLEVCAFIGSSAIRQYAEKWSIAEMVRLSRDAVAFSVAHQLPVMFVTEDTTRAHPELIRQLYSAALAAGAQRLCVCDTCGHATPEGVRRLIGFVGSIVEEHGASIGIDWHGHRDRGLGLANALAALDSGATRLHASALGIGERTGNVEMDLLLVNLRMLDLIGNDLTRLHDYVTLASASLDVPIPPNYPVFGRDAFLTATGVHAAAVAKALEMGDLWLANRVYSAVPADLVGLEQVIAVGPMSGRSNVRSVLKKHGVGASEQRVEEIREFAKRSRHLMTDDEVIALARR